MPRKLTTAEAYGMAANWVHALDFAEEPLIEFRRREGRADRELAAHCLSYMNAVRVTDGFEGEQERRQVAALAYFFFLIIHGGNNA
jgi:hypothetical protein